MAPSYLYRPFMGHSTRFAALNSPLTRADITRLERESLAHVTPGRVNDHICIGMVKTLRWIADRAFRERYIHRATMLVTVAAAAPAAGSVAAYLRMFFKRRPTDITGGSSVKKRTSVAAEVASPFLAADRASRRSAPTSSQASGSRLHHNSTPNSPVSGAPLRHSYVDELRGLLAQSECHAVHYQILSSMAEITAVERGLVLLLQAFHFGIYLALFLFYPRMGFRLMAYTAEESSVVWTQMVNDVDLGKIAELRVPKLALHYWGLEGTFTAQGALVPMVVPPKSQDVVVFRGGEGRGVGEAAVAAVKRDGDAGVNTSTPSVRVPEEKPSEATAAPDVKVPESTVKEAATLPPGDAGSQAAAMEGEGTTEREEALVNPLYGDSSETVFTLRDVVLLIRSDEMSYRDANHEMANELDTQPGFLRNLIDRYAQK